MKNIVNVLCILVIVLAAAGGAMGQKPAELKTVPSVDIKRYLGKWYEIAKYPNKFQKQCVGNTTATYSQKPNGKLEVINECLTKDGTKDVAKGEAKIVEGSSNAKLKVRFAPSALSFLSAVWGNYWVIDLGRDYEYAVVGEPKREYFWILSRKAEMSDRDYQDILRRAEAMGFVPGKIERTQQDLTSMKGGVVPK